MQQFFFIDFFPAKFLIEGYAIQGHMELVLYDPANQVETEC